MNSPRAVLLGIDGGGTSTDAALADEQGNILGRGKAGPSNAKAIGPERAREALGASIADAFADAGLDPAPVEVACLGLAGFDRPEDKALLADWSGAAVWARRLIPANDAELVLAAGTPEGWGVALIAGTGSIAFGRTADGRTARAGGWGPLIGDEGSAYRVALDALKEVARRADGRSKAPDPDLFSERICAAVGVRAPRDLVTVLYGPDWDRARIASLAPEVIAAADDEFAIDISYQLRELAVMVFAVANALKLRGEPSTIPPMKPIRNLRMFASEFIETFASRVDRSSGGRSDVSGESTPHERPIPLAMAGGFLLKSGPLVGSLREGTGASTLYGAVLGMLEKFECSCIGTPVPEPVLGAVTLARRALS